MTSRHLVSLVAVFALLASGALSAQRGGRAMNFERPEAATSFDSEELGLRFESLPGLLVFTPKAPGRFGGMLKDGRFLYVGSSEMRRANLLAKASPNMSDADVEGYKRVLDTNPPQARLEGFKKHSVRYITIGRQRDKQALEFVYDLIENGAPSTVRQVVFVHKGRGFTFTCTSFQAEYGLAEKEIFEPVLSHLEFR